MVVFFKSSVENLLMLFYKPFDVSVELLSYGNQGLVIWKNNQLTGFHSIDFHSIDKLDVKKFPSYGLM